MGRYLRPAAIIGLSMFAATPALAGAQIEFSAYEGSPVIKTGQGGTKVTKNNFDYWTSGEPPRRYQVIGLITDKRDEEWDGGRAVGSPNVARKVKAAGGDAVIVETQEEAGKTGGGGFNGFFAFGGSKTMTRMLAIKYLPAEDSPNTSPQSPSPAP